LNVVVFILSLLLSMLMSSFEMAYVRKAPFFNAGKFDDILHDRTGVLATVLFWNTVALVFGSISLYDILSSLHVPGVIVLSGVIAALTFAVFGDFFPKLLAISHLDRVFRLELYPFLVFYFLSHLLLITKLAKSILRSKYSREEVIDMILAYLSGRIGEVDLKFAAEAMGAFYSPAHTYAVEGGDACAEMSEDASVMDVLRIMRERRCTRVRVGEGVFDLHTFLKMLSRRALSAVE